MAKWQQGEQTELPDDEPLSAEDMAHIERQRIQGQSALIHRAAAQGMTPMEMMASGQVTAHAPDDALAFDKSQQLPSARNEIRLDAETIQREILFQNPKERPAISEDVEEILALVKEAGIDVAPHEEAIVRIIYAESEPPTPPWERPRTEFRGRMEEWLVKDGGRSFAEGFNGYFKDRPSRAPEPEVVPPTSEPVDEDEVVEGEIVHQVRRIQPVEEDIVDAEVVEDD